MVVDGLDDANGSGAAALILHPEVGSGRGGGGGDGGSVVRRHFRRVGNAEFSDGAMELETKSRGRLNLFSLLISNPFLYPTVSGAKLTENHLIKKKIIKKKTPSRSHRKDG